MGLGGLWWSNVLNSALPPQTLRPDTRPGHQDPVSHTVIMKLEVAKMYICKSLLFWLMILSPMAVICSWKAKTFSYSHDHRCLVLPNEMKCVSQNQAASIGGSPAEAGGSCGSLQGQGHWQQKFWKVLLGVSPPQVRF